MDYLCADKLTGNEERYAELHAVLERWAGPPEQRESGTFRTGPPEREGACRAYGPAAGLRVSSWYMEVPVDTDTDLQAGTWTDQLGGTELVRVGRKCADTRREGDLGTDIG